MLEELEEMLPTTESDAVKCEAGVVTNARIMKFELLLLYCDLIQGAAGWGS